MSTEIGVLIKKARTDSGMSQADLAKVVDGISASDISKAERGMKELTPDQLKAIAEATGVTPESLMDDVAEDPSLAVAEEVSSDAAEEAAQDTPVSLTDSEKELLELYKGANAGLQKTVMFVLKNGKQLVPKLKATLASLMKNSGGNNGSPFAQTMGGSNENGDENPISCMLGGLIGVISSLMGKACSEENRNGQVSGSLLAFTYFYSVSIYILLLSFYFWQWRTDIKPEKKDDDE